MKLDIIFFVTAPFSSAVGSSGPSKPLSPICFTIGVLLSPNYLDPVFLIRNVAALPPRLDSRNGERTSPPNRSDGDPPPPAADRCVGKSWTQRFRNIVVKPARKKIRRMLSICGHASLFGALHLTLLSPSTNSSGKSHDTEVSVSGGFC